ncbi:hypothetical protein R3P38DRAFT_2776237 [Favolaschia claudopus]|uniref:Uncharacterized protein n=1 Tax=Favolaschia claudopus TaxID=2862362 RepID=A0AAW0BQX1_9AGAR
MTHPGLRSTQPFCSQRDMAHNASNVADATGRGVIGNRLARMGRQLLDMTPWDMHASRRRWHRDREMQSRPIAAFMHLCSYVRPRAQEASQEAIIMSTKDLRWFEPRDAPEAQQTAIVKADGGLSASSRRVRGQEWVYIVDTRNPHEMTLPPGKLAAYERVERPAAGRGTGMYSRVRSSRRNTTGARTRLTRHQERNDERLPLRHERRREKHLPSKDLNKSERSSTSSRHSVALPLRARPYMPETACPSSLYSTKHVRRSEYMEGRMYLGLVSTRNHRSKREGSHSAAPSQFYATILPESCETKLLSASATILPVCLQSIVSTQVYMAPASPRDLALKFEDASIVLPTPNRQVIEFLQTTFKASVIRPQVEAQGFETTHRFEVWRRGAKLSRRIRRKPSEIAMTDDFNLSFFWFSGRFLWPREAFSTSEA